MDVNKAIDALQEYCVKTECGKCDIRAICQVNFKYDPFTWKTKPFNVIESDGKQIKMKF